MRNTMLCPLYIGIHCCALHFWRMHCFVLYILGIHCCVLHIWGKQCSSWLNLFSLRPILTWAAVIRSCIVVIGWAIGNHEPTEGSHRGHLHDPLELLWLWQLAPQQLIHRAVVTTYPATADPLELLIAAVTTGPATADPLELL